MPVEPEPADDEPVEIAGEEVGQVEGAGLLVGERLERGGPGVELVAVGAGQALDTVAVEDAVQAAAGPAVGIGDEDRVVPSAPRSPIRRATAAGIPLRAVVERTPAGTSTSMPSKPLRG